jgi:hypothetical protein
MIIYFYFKGNYTYDKKGTKCVNSVTSGQEKTKVSCSFCASSNGDKLPVLILIPRKRPLKDFITPDIVLVVYNANNKLSIRTQLVVVLSRE